MPLLPVPRAALSWLCCLTIVLAVAGCAPEPEQANVSMAWELAPDPPRVGPATLALALSDSTGRPLEGARVEVEGNMAHPGMQPVLASAEETTPGRYVADLTWTMPGDWFVLVTATLPDARSAQWQIDVPGVRSSER